MITGATVISEYQEYSYKKRIDFILRNYYGIEEYIRGYEDILCDNIMVDRIVDRRDSYGDTGIRVQTSNMGDSTSMTAVERESILEKMSEKALTRHISDDPELKYEAITLRTMKRDLGFVNRAIRMLPGRDRRELGELLCHEKTIDDVAEEKGILYESAKMAVYRTRLKVKKNALEFMKRAAA